LQKDFLKETEEIPIFGIRQTHDISESHKIDAKTQNQSKIKEVKALFW